MACPWFGILFVACVSSYTITQSNVDEQLRRVRPVFVKGERQFAIVDQERCVEKMMCLVERHIPDHNTLKHVSKILANEHNEVDPEAFSKITTNLKEFPYMDRMVASVYVGRNSTDDLTCSTTYAECTVSERELLAEAHKYDKNAQVAGSVITGKRDRNCAVTGGACAAGGVACGICAGFLEMFCFDPCMHIVEECAVGITEHCTG